MHRASRCDSPEPISITDTHLPLIGDGVPLRVLHHRIPLTAEHRTALAWALSAALTQRYVQYATLEYDADLWHAAHPAALPGPTTALPGPTTASAAMTDQWWTPADPV